MRVLAGTILAMFVIAALTACATLIAPAADKLAGAVVKYCNNEPLQFRRAYRDTLDGSLPEGFAVHVHCPGDPDHPHPEPL